MIKQVNYIAEDGTVFNNESDCRKHETECEKTRNEAVFSEAGLIDVELCKKYCFDIGTPAIPPLNLAIEWLKSDIAFILTIAKDVKQTEKEITDYIRNSYSYGEYILTKIDFEDINAEVSVRRDYSTALRKAKSGRNLSSIIHYALGKIDLKELAQLHKSRKFREKIESLLEDCNFHKECSDFISGNYDEYINVE